MKFVLAFVVFALLHTFLASHVVKKHVIAVFPSARFWYRSFYNIISVLTLGLVWFFTPIPDVLIYQMPPVVFFIFRGFQLLGIMGLLWSVRHFGGSTFTGIEQLKHLFEKNPPSYFLDEPENNKLILKGPFKLVRHPLYFFSIIILFFQPIMTLKWLIFSVLSALYFWFGSIPEEQKLIDRFGDEYLLYKKSVPRIFPNLSFFSKRSISN